MYNNRECELLQMVDVTAQLKFDDAKSNLELLKALQASVSHDMRAPLAAIIATSTILLNEMTDSKLKGIMMPIHTASKMLHCQVNDLLDSSLLLRGKFEIQVAKFDLYKAINDVVGVVAYGNIRNNTINSYIE
jgi:K+-sensing histidine kinase KdpD